MITKELALCDLARDTLRLQRPTDFCGTQVCALSARAKGFAATAERALVCR